MKIFSISLLAFACVRASSLLLGIDSASHLQIIDSVSGSFTNVAFKNGDLGCLKKIWDAQIDSSSQNLYTFHLNSEVPEFVVCSWEFQTLGTQKIAKGRSVGELAGVPGDNIRNNYLSLAVNSGAIYVTAKYDLPNYQREWRIKKYDFVLDKVTTLARFSYIPGSWDRNKNSQSFVQEKDGRKYLLVDFKNSGSAYLFWVDCETGKILDNFEFPVHPILVGVSPNRELFGFADVTEQTRLRFQSSSNGDLAVQSYSLFRVSAQPQIPDSFKLFQQKHSIGKPEGSGAVTAYTVFQCFEFGESLKLVGFDGSSGAIRSAVTIPKIKKLLTVQL